MRISRGRLTVIVLVTLAGMATVYILLDRRIREARALDDGVVAFKNGDYLEAVARLVPLADQGESAAQRVMAHAYAYGLGVPRDRVRAYQLILASEDGDAGRTCLHYAQQFERGGEVERDNQEALAWYFFAATRGEKEAQRVLANAYRLGRLGLTSDPQKAAYWEQASLGK